MDNFNKHGKNTLAALALLAFIPLSAAYAEEDDATDSASAGHWFMGGSWGNLRPDDDRMAGTTRIFGAHGGYQFNDNWSFQLGYASSAGRHDDDYEIGTPWGARVRMYEMGFTRYWGDKYRVLFDFGYNHLSMDASGPDDATMGWYLGTGLSTFVTDNIELRGDIKGVYSPNEKHFDQIGTVTLNWHFVDARSASVDNRSALGDSTEEAQALPPVSYREEPVAEAVEPAPVEVAPAPAEVVAPVAAVAAAPQVTETTEFVSPTAVPTSTHTLLQFGNNSLDVGAQNGSQLDQLSQEIKSTDAKALIEGHTDSVGSAESNKVLSLDRAIVVKRELKNRGVSSDRLHAVGLGEEQPVATNDTAEGRAQNRRVEVKIYDNK